MPYGYYGYYFDPTYILIIIAAIIIFKGGEYVRNDRCTGSKNDFAVKRNK